MKSGKRRSQRGNNLPKCQRRSVDTWSFVLVTDSILVGRDVEGVGSVPVFISNIACVEFDACISRLLGTLSGIKLKHDCVEVRVFFTQQPVASFCP